MAQAAPTDQKWDLEADVVVIGSGAAGLPAAIKAADGGASVIVVEANYDIGGHAIIRNAPGRGYAFGGRIDHDPATVLDDWILAFAPAELKQIEPAVRALLVRIEAISGASQTGTAGGRGIRAHAP